MGRQTYTGREASFTDVMWPWYCAEPFTSLAQAVSSHYCTWLSSVMVNVAVRIEGAVTRLGRVHLTAPEEAAGWYRRGQLCWLVGFGPRCVPCGILAPRPGIEPTPPALEAQSLNHWTAREAQLGQVLKDEHTLGKSAMGGRGRGRGGHQADGTEDIGAQKHERELCSEDSKSWGWCPPARSLS